MLEFLIEKLKLLKNLKFLYLDLSSVRTLKLIHLQALINQQIYFNQNFIQATLCLQRLFSKKTINSMFPNTNNWFIN